jgi:hypothetical protein
VIADDIDHAIKQKTGTRSARLSSRRFAYRAAAASLISNWVRRIPFQVSARS